ncbi:hypothetical protein Hanom_Chr14g01319991 [Helianthus anomalus]
MEEEEVATVELRRWVKHKQRPAMPLRLCCVWFGRLERERERGKLTIEGINEEHLQW